jgi:LacI family transcriptional regulator
MHEIAARAGVGKATVSLALRDDPRLRPETRLRIQRLAAKMGYRTNATIANLMAQLRASRTPKYQATLALVNALPDPDAPAKTRPFREWIAGCEQRASELGYGFEPFWLHDPNVAPVRLATLLQSRGIRGLVIAGPTDPDGSQDLFAPLWHRFSCVSAGLRPVSPALNFSSNDQFSTALQAVRHLWKNGYRRIALVLSPDIDAAVDRRFSAGFWAAQEAFDGCARIPQFAFHPARGASFRDWHAEHRPDAILTLHDEVKKWLDAMEVDVPGEIALAHLDHHDQLPAWSGIRQNNLLIGAAAIDMLVGQLHRNESGLPDSQKASFIQSTWIDGLTTARRNTHQAKAPEAVSMVS